jgi:ABC-type Zn uptake system ZnuABC Zn-binding protein ZnuA
MRTPIGAVLVAAALAAALAACGVDGAASSTDERLVVATTVSPITSIAATVAGDRATVVGLVPKGTNSHTFEPRPSVAATLAQADLIIINGLMLEEPTKALAETNKRDGAELVELGNLTIGPDEYLFDFSFPEEEGKPNPHLWTNPPMAKRYTEIVADKMAAADPGNAGYYRSNAAALAGQIDELDAAMRTAFETIPPAHKKLLTYHDAYAYFARDYGWEVIGAIQVSDFEDPTPREVAALIEQVKASGVPAIFGSEVFPSPVLAQIGREANVEYVDELRDDDLPGGPGDPDHSLLGLLRLNYATMTRALGGDPSALEALTFPPVAPDQATYPQ